MKKSRLSLLLLSSILLVGCGVEDSSTTNTSTPSTSVADTSNTETSVPDSSSSGPESVALTTAYSVFKDAVEAMTKKDAIEVKAVKDEEGVTNASLSVDAAISTKNTYYLATGELDTTQGVNGVSTATDGVILELENIYFDVAAKNLQSTTENALAASVNVASDLNFVYSPSGSTTTTKINEDDVELSMYVKDGDLYIDMDNGSMISLLDSLLSIITGTSGVASYLPSYWLIEDGLSYIEDSLPDISFDFSTDDSEEYSAIESYSSYLSNVITVTKEEDEYYYDIDINSSFLSILPLLYEAIAKAGLDSTADSYEDDLAEIQTNKTTMNNIVNSLTLTSFAIDLVLDSTGFTSIETDIDVTMKNYVLEQETYTFDDKTSMETSTVIDSLDYVQTGKTLFYYNDAVKVESPGNHNYVDLSSYLTNLLG